jgi:hypothetical protein
MVSDAQTEGTFSIPLLEQARTALSRLAVIRLVGVLVHLPRPEQQGSGCVRLHAQSVDLAR